MLRLKAFAAFTTLLFTVAIAHAGQGSVRLTTFPDMAVADARSTITVTAEVRENSGRPCVNGTKVVFQTTSGHFQDSSVSTTDGFARAVLITGGTAGTAKITASAVTLGASATGEVEFVRSRSELATANSYVQIE
ncbi:MAG: invasin domain 3-containing protein, partial [Armatimonadota bacterium]